MMADAVENQAAVIAQLEQHILDVDSAHDRLLEENITLCAEQTRLREALKTIEFGIASAGKCPACVGWDGSKNGRGETPGRHTKDCWLAAVLSSTPTPETTP
jgi:hypothetical protein